MSSKAASNHQHSQMSFHSQASLDYATLAKEVYACAKIERWNAEKIKNMLQNPKDFEKYMQRVSSNFSQTLSLFCVFCVRVQITIKTHPTTLSQKSYHQ